MNFKRNSINLIMTDLLSLVTQSALFNLWLYYWWSAILSRFLILGRRRRGSSRMGVRALETTVPSEGEHFLYVREAVKQNRLVWIVYKNKQILDCNISTHEPDVEKFMNKFDTFDAPETKDDEKRRRLSAGFWTGALQRSSAKVQILQETSPRIKNRKNTRRNTTRYVKRNSMLLKRNFTTVRQNPIPGQSVVYFPWSTRGPTGVDAGTKPTLGMTTSGTMLVLTAAAEKTITAPTWSTVSQQTTTTGTTGYTQSPTARVRKGKLQNYVILFSNLRCNLSLSIWAAWLLRFQLLKRIISTLCSLMTHLK